MNEMSEKGYECGDELRIKKDRKRADIIVDQNYKTPTKNDAIFKLHFQNLEEALLKCNDGNVIFIENGTYTTGDDTSFLVSQNNLTIIGSTNTVLMSRLRVYIPNCLDTYPATS